MFSTEVPGAAHSGRRETRRLPALGSIGVAGATAAIVFGSGVWLMERGAPAKPRSELAATAPALPLASATGATSVLATTSAAVVKLQPTLPGNVAETARHDVVLGPSASAPEIAAPSPAAPGATEVGRSVPSVAMQTQYRPGYGGLRVTSPLHATVYVKGIAKGPANSPLEVRCGRFFVRLGEPTADGTRWLGEGRSIAVRCGALTEFVF